MRAARRRRSTLGVAATVLALLIVSNGAASARYGGEESGGGGGGGGYRGGDAAVSEDDDSDRPEDPGGGPPADNDHPRKPEGEQGNKPENPGGGRPSDPGSDLGGMYADLVLALRDVNGLPILDDNACVRPVSHVPITVDPIEGETVQTVANPVDGSPVWLVPLYGDVYTEDDLTEETEFELCDVIGGEESAYAAYITEADLGRLNIARSPDAVLQQQLRDLITTLGAGTTLGLDPAGRLRVDADLETEKTIDSPLQNLAVHTEMLIHGDITVRGTTSVLGWVNTGYFGSLDPAGPWAAMQHAAVGLAMGADKAGEINVDVVQYMGRILQTAATMDTGTLGGDGYLCVLGDTTLAGLAFDAPTCGIPGEVYVDFSGYTYDRAATFPGCVTYWDVTGETPAKVGPVPILSVADVTPTVNAANVAGFAQHGDDARAVNLWVHDMGALVIAVDTVGMNAHCTPPAPIE